MRRLPRLFAATLAAALAGGLLAVPTAEAARSQLVPAARHLPALLDAVPAYQAPQACDPTAKIGPRLLQKLLTKTYGAGSFGITRTCSGTPSSEHQEGRALDWMIPTAQRPQAKAFLSWLLAKDATGQRAAMARRMGIMYVVWNNRMFRTYDTERGWTEYNSCFTSGGATDCHRDHVHFSFSWDGAYGLTSYWSGKAVWQPDCDRPWWDAERPSMSKKGLEFFALPPTPVLNTATGHGVASGLPCRIAQAGWTGDTRRFDLTVAGVGAVPADAKAVVLQLRVRRPNASAGLRVMPAGLPAWASRVLTTVPRKDGYAVVTVPLGTEGAVSVQLTRGQTLLAADVVGYYRASMGEGGLLHAANRLALDTAGSPPALAEKERRFLSRTALGVPASATAVVLEVTVSGGSRAGGVRLTSGDAATPTGLAVATAAKGKTATVTTFVPLGLEGARALQLANQSGTRDVKVVVKGWFAGADVAGGTAYTPAKPTVGS